MKRITQFIILVALFYANEIKARLPNGSGELQGKVYRISLKKDLIPDTADIKPGMGNLFFSTTFNTKEIKISKHWKNAEVAAVIENDSFLISAFIARYKDEKGVYRYFPDRNCNGDFNDEKELVFIGGTHGLNVADVFLTIRSKRKITPNRVVHYQILNPIDIKEKDKYVYALLKEYRTGILRIGNFSSKIELYSFFRRPYLQRDGNGISFFIDFNEDGIVNKKAYIGEDSVPVRSESILDPQSPISINKIVLKFKLLDIQGNWIEFEKQDSNIGFGEGFIFPPENTKYTNLSKDNAETRLIPDSEGLTLLILSSTSCLPCERIRPTLNKLNDEFKSKGLNSFILLRENDPQEITEYISKHEYSAQALTSDKESWTKLNSRTMVPMFYLINSSGLIIYKDIGAGINQEYFLKWYIKKNLPID